MLQALPEAISWFVVHSLYMFHLSLLAPCSDNKKKNEEQSESFQVDASFQQFTSLA